MHSIHLRHPWQSEVQAGTVVWSRAFNWPAKLDVGEVVQLVVEKVPASARVMLNDHELGAASQIRYDVTSLLVARNEVKISIAESESMPDERFPYQVRLNIVATEEQ